jgi:hypothetical protein
MIHENGLPTTAINESPVGNGQRRRKARSQLATVESNRLVVGETRGNSAARLLGSQRCHNRSTTAGGKLNAFQKLSHRIVKPAL